MQLVDRKKPERCSGFFLLLRQLLMRQLKIDVLSALVVTDKLELGEPQASGKSAPAGA
ncbi:MAG: hypothetical protein IJO38_03790 [Akkermansia sp.]|nr:hypothetical protein [Akkermansia sp.]